MSLLRLRYLCGLFAGMVVPANAQNPAVHCLANAAVPPLVRAEGLTEALSDLVLLCTGGTPTPAGQQAPQITLSISANTRLTSRVTAGNLFSEALLLVDEPNSPNTITQRPLRNCGFTPGAPGNGPLGPGICSIVSTGDPAATYDGTANTYGANACDGNSGRPAPDSYGCGRPNAFQGRVTSDANRIDFVGLPFDPPGSVGARILRITNLRANAVLIPPGSFPAGMIQVNITASDPGLAISNPLLVAAFTQPGLAASIQIPAPAGGATATVRLSESFPSSWKTRNLSSTVGDLLGTPGNAAFDVVTNTWQYNGAANHPQDIAQNVPGAIYWTESMFQWRNNAANGPPSPNPPQGFSNTTVANLGEPLFSASTGIANSGIADSATRLALIFTGVPKNMSVLVPSLVKLKRQISGADAGVMVLTGTDLAGAGTFTPAEGTSIRSGTLAVYEILYSSPFGLEYADIECTLDFPGKQLSPGSAFNIGVSAAFAPFYSTPDAGFATPSLFAAAPEAIPRFAPGTQSLLLFEKAKGHLP